MDSSTEKAAPEAVPDIEKAQEPPKDDAPPVRTIHGFKWVLVVLTINIGTFLFALDNKIVADVQAAVVEDFGEDAVAKVPWLANAFALAAASFLLPWGKIFATFNSNYLYIIAVVIFEAGSALCGGAPNMDALIVGRAVSGFRAIGIYIGVLAILSGNTSERERPTYLGFAGAMWGLASVLGPVFGGAFVASAGGWRWAFYINLVLGTAMAPVLIFLLPSKNPQPGIPILPIIGRWICA